MKFNLEQPSQEEKETQEINIVDDIKEKLSDSATEFFKALEESKSGSEDALNLLAQMQQDLIQWREKLKENESNLYFDNQIPLPRDEAIFREVNHRLHELTLIKPKRNK